MLMIASKRRKEIVNQLKGSSEPIVARELAEKYDVSRQVIVGDIALLRASGEDILSTPNGYTMRLHTETRYKKKIVCQHSKEQTKEELSLIVEHGGEIIDVSVDHPIYGEMNGALNIQNKEDIESFIRQINQEEVSLLSDLTDGLHTHTISAKNKNTIETIEKALEEKGLLYSS